MEYHLIFNFNFFNLSVFELVGFQTKLFKDLWYMYYHAVKVFSMFFLSSLDLCSAYCVRLIKKKLTNIKLSLHIYLKIQYGAASIQERLIFKKHFLSPIFAAINQERHLFESDL